MVSIGTGSKSSVYFTTAKGSRSSITLEAMEKKNCTEDTARSASEGIWRKTQQNCMMRRCTYITNPSPLKQLGNKLKNVTPWASRDKNTNRNSCGDYPTCVPCHDTRSCQLPACSKPLINVRCERGEWLDDLRRLGIINFVGDILTLLTFISIGLAIAEYFLCPPLNSSASSDKSYFFCTSCSDAPAAPPQRPPPPPEEEPPPPPPPPPEEEPPPPEEEPPPPEEEPPPPPPEEEEENEPLIEEEEPPPEEDEPPLEDEEEEEPPPVYDDRGTHTQHVDHTGIEPTTFHDIN
ncbi:hypothetical protein RRG08_041961 [Elysia crispata]|uniref:Uncharacterized protein n=1 Tax=Elysia crispata TaxID=231223 RepID=A0AAE0XWZ3_9GAST|nr:hypothetical protein RRG08_041961 [Elysia crispata]